MIKRIIKVKIRYIIVLQFLLLAILIEGSSISSYSGKSENTVKASLDFFSDSIVSCHSAFYNWNIILMDSVIPISLDAFGTMPCENCKEGIDEISDYFPSVLTPIKEIKFDRRIIGAYKDFPSFESSDTMEVVFKGLFKLKSKKELVVFECTKRLQYDITGMDVYILLESGKVENSCIIQWMKPNPW